MSNKDKRKKMLKRLSKIRRSERKDKKKKRTKNRSSSRNSLYQEYAYQQQNRSSTYLLVLFIVILLAAVGVVVYFFAIKPKLDEEKKECNIDCGETKYLNKEDCECLPCITPTCEPKHYYDTSKCGINFHGDSERKKVIACSLGESRPIHWQWYSNSKPIGDRIKFTINSGDMYIMSEKTTGYDWKKSSKKTLRHAAGIKYVG